MASTLPPSVRVPEIDARSTGFFIVPQHRKGRPSEHNGRTVVVPIDVLDGLRPYAESRRISVNELVRRLLDTAVDEAMVDAILDDTEAA